VTASLARDLAPPLPEPEILAPPGRFGGARDRIAFFSRCIREDGSTVRISSRQALYVLNAPADIRHVLVTNHANYVKTRRVSTRRSDWPSTGSLMTSSGSAHRRRRRTLQPIFRQPLIELLVSRTQDNAERFCEALADGQIVDTRLQMRALAERNILETIFGPLPEEAVDRLVRSSLARSRFTAHVFFSNVRFPEYLPRRLIVDHALASRRHDRIADTAIERERRGERCGHMLSLLMSASDGEGSCLSDRDLRDELRTLTLTGYESVGDGLAWTSYLLARYPDIQEAIRAPDAEPLTARVIRESLRVYPPTWLFVRKARDADLLPSGTSVEAGAQLCISPWVVHRNPGLWPDPERFDPDRFLPSEADWRPRYAYLPFGGGPHTCIGESLAMAEIMAAIAVLTSHHRLVLASAQSPSAEGGLTLRAAGLRLRFQRRTD